MRLKVHVLLGPTASGKTEVAVELARAIDAEVISADSMKVYRGMDIGTAKPPPGERRGVRYHLLDIRSPREPYSVSEFVRDADAAAREIASRGRAVLMEGGTALYMKAFSEGLFDSPPASAELRGRLEREAAEEGVELLHGRLKGVDPEAASRIDRRDLRRVVRALEVYELTGNPISSLQKQWGRTRTGLEPVWAGLSWPRELLYARINGRVERMMGTGLLDEVRRIDSETGFGKQASQAVGYKELSGHLKGSYGLDRAAYLIKRNTRRFARHQMTWFRKFGGVAWVDMKGKGPREAAEEVLLRWRCR